MRMLTSKFAFAVAATVMLSGAATAQQQAPAAAPPPPLIDWDKIEIKTIDLGNKTYMLTGQGGNITVAARANANLDVSVRMCFPRLFCSRGKPTPPHVRL